MRNRGESCGPSADEVSGSRHRIQGAAGPGASLLKALALVIGAASTGWFSGCIKEQSRSVDTVHTTSADTAGDSTPPADTAETDTTEDTTRRPDTQADTQSDTGADTGADTRPDTSPTGCGDGRCEPGETRIGCPADCGCGNGTCEAVETEITCPIDCCGGSVCGDCTCDAACGETTATCPRDCWACGDGLVSPGEIDCGCLMDACRCQSGGAGCGDGCCMGYLCGEGPDNCPQDCGTGCGNAECEPGETPITCAEDCALGVCGNGLCESTRNEGPSSCPADCAAACGNCECEPGETYLNCPPDCGLCGDGVCSNCPALSERDGCPQDCGIDERR